MDILILIFGFVVGLIFLVKGADEMVDSRWYKQVTNRAERLVARMRAI